MKILINFPTRNRPVKAQDCLFNINQFADAPVDILLKVDFDDSSSNYGFWKDYPNVIKVGGRSHNKIHAINRGDLLSYDWDILLNHSDDMWFIRPFAKQIIADMERHHPDTDGCLFYSDGYAPNLWTYSIIGRKYYERDGYIYNPEYISLWCDNEAMEVADMRGKLTRCEAQLFQHRHPAWGASAYDEQYRQQGAMYRVDEQTFITRKANNFGIK